LQERSPIPYLPALHLFHALLSSLYTNGFT
jgi:hypothetical protein